MIELQEAPTKSSAMLQLHKELISWEQLGDNVAGARRRRAVETSPNKGVSAAH